MNWFYSTAMRITKSYKTEFNLVSTCTIPIRFWISIDIASMRSISTRSPSWSKIVTETHGGWFKTIVYKNSTCRQSLTKQMKHTIQESLLWGNFARCMSLMVSNNSETMVGERSQDFITLRSLRRKASWLQIYPNKSSFRGPSQMSQGYSVEEHFTASW